MVAMPFLLGVDTTILNKCSNFVHKIKYKGMEGKRYNNSFTSTGIVKEEGRVAYHKLLENTGNYGVKRMFLYMAEKAGHYWLDELNTNMIELETSKLQLVPGGVYISKYKITIPQSLNSYEG